MKIKTVINTLYKVYFKDDTWQYFCAANLGTLQQLLNASYKYHRLEKIEIMNDQVIVKKDK